MDHVLTDLLWFLAYIAFSLMTQGCDGIAEPGSVLRNLSDTSRECH